MEPRRQFGDHHFFSSTAGIGPAFGEFKFGFGSLCTSLHKDPYAQFPVINSWGSLGWRSRL
jgi:hypothetical protein